jgi:hypothetical protein
VPCVLEKDFYLGTPSPFDHDVTPFRPLISHHGNKTLFVVEVAPLWINEVGPCKSTLWTKRGFNN